MTTQELRELDAWIAEHVMGFKYNPKYNTFDDGETVWGSFELNAPHEPRGAKNQDA